MSIAIVTGASGLVGSEAVKSLHARGLDVVGVDNDMRAYYFTVDASTKWNADRLASLPRYTQQCADVRDQPAIDALFSHYGRDIALIVHCAGQPSHDWAEREPLTDFSVNAMGTLVMLEATRKHAPDATFVFTSTNKVYGDTPNRLPMVEEETRWEPAPEHPYARDGIDESMSIDASKHSLFGVSKASADLMVQEYGRYFGMNTVVFRGGCLTGPAHGGVELHGFLAYLVKCQLTERPYKIYGYKGKQVRDNIHSADLVNAFWAYHQAPRPGEVYNMGGSRHSHCSVLEATALVEELSGKKLNYTVEPTPRIGDHIWWISNIAKFRAHYPNWQYRYDLKSTLREMVAATADRERVKL